MLLSVAAVIAVAAPAAQQPFRAGVDLVHFAVVVTDKQGTPVTGLSVEDFEVLEEGKAQAVRYFTAGDDGPQAGALPLHLGLALDTSGSMEKDIHVVRSAVVKFLNANTTAVDVTLVDFDTEVRVARYSSGEYARLIERIRMRKPDGWTAFYDALGVYLNGAASQLGQKILLVYTDGGDTRSSLTYSDLLDLLKASDVTLYAIGYLERYSSSAKNEARMQLQRIAGATGGQAFFPTSVKELDRIYESIQREISARYSLGYISSDTRFDGSWRDVKIRLKRPELRQAKLRTRAGYFAPYREGGH
ncbi:MAG TPA: VWA domain-containing protein [Vicinamibacterales bacterium]|nr:VWA domain-containing protein [Vicinamibacterales bacterium]